MNHNAHEINCPSQTDCTINFWPADCKLTTVTAWLMFHCKKAHVRDGVCCKQASSPGKYETNCHLSDLVKAFTLEISSAWYHYTFFFSSFYCFLFHCSHWPCFQMQLAAVFSNSARLCFTCPAQNSRCHKITGDNSGSVGSGGVRCMHCKTGWGQKGATSWVSTEIIFHLHLM